MDYPYGKFGDCILSRFGFIVQTNKQTESHTHTDVDEHLTPVTVISMSSYITVIFIL